MSSNLRIEKICGYCTKEFIAKTTVTKFCSHRCASRAYKKRKREGKIQEVTEVTIKQKVENKTGINPELLKYREHLSVKEANFILGISERTLFRLLKMGTLRSSKIGGRRLIKRSDIDKLFE